MSTWPRFRLAVAAVLVCLSFAARATPENGWWWNPDESGRGFFLEWQGDQIFVVGYFYETDGRATWMSAGGTMTTPYAFAGRLFAYRGGQTLWGDYVAPAGWTDNGELRLEFDSADRGTLTWPGGTIRLQRHVFASGTAPFQPTGWWWNPDESGRGFSIEIQGDTLFMGAFMYDASGNPVWYISSGKLASPTRYSGTLQRAAGGQTMGGPYRPPASLTQVGTVSIEFASEEEATLTLTGEGVAALGIHAGADVTSHDVGTVAEPTRRSTRLRPQMTRLPPMPSPPVRFTGNMRKRYSAPFFGGEMDVTIEAPNSVWGLVASPTPWPAKYHLTEGRATATVRGTANGGACTLSGEKTIELDGLAAYFNLDRNGNYSALLTLAEMDADIEVRLTCAGAVQTFTSALSIDFELERGRLQRGYRMFNWRVPVATSLFYLSYSLVLDPAF